MPPASASNDELMQRVEAQAKQMQVSQWTAGVCGRCLKTAWRGPHTNPHPQHPFIIIKSQTQQIRESFGRLEGDQERKAAAAEAMAKNYAMKLDVVKQVGVCAHVGDFVGIALPVRVLRGPLLKPPARLTSFISSIPSLRSRTLRSRAASTTTTSGSRTPCTGWPSRSS